MFQAETITGNTISGVAFKDGKEYLRTFGGGYTYKTNELFLFCGIPQKKVEPFNVGKNEDVIAAISEADEDNSRIPMPSSTQRRRNSGVVISLVEGFRFFRGNVRHHVRTPQGGYGGGI